ncbi:hypothetical protein [Succinimonas sp.]
MSDLQELTNELMTDEEFGRDEEFRREYEAIQPAALNFLLAFHISPS